MVAQFDGGVLYSGDRVIARTEISNYGSGGFDLRLSTVAFVPLPSGMAGMGNCLPEIQTWLARHPEALAPRPPRRIGGDPRWASWQRPHRPVAERIPALTVRRRDSNGNEIWVQAAPSYVRRNPYYIPLAGPMGRLP